MKIRISQKVNQLASALLVVMILGGILCVFVLYYLALVQQQTTLSARSQAWNIAIAISEAGIEEGLQVLNTYNNNPATDPNWSFDGTYYWRTNQDASLGGNWYSVAIDLRNPLVPEITSRAHVTMSALAQATPAVMFANAGVKVGAGPITRAVRVRCSRGNLFLAALVAKHKIDLRGKGVLTDSFDSQSLWKSYFGRYNDKWYVGDKGDVASNDGIVSSISVQNAKIYGHASTGPDGTVTIGDQGYVGEHSKYAPATIQSGWVLHNANFTFPVTSLPYDSGLDLGGPETIVTTTTSITSSNVTSSTYPASPPWSGVTVNYLTNSLTTTTYPEAGTYLGLVKTNYPGNSSNEKSYTYAHINGTNYTWAIYKTNAVIATNYYDHVLTSGDYYTTDDLKGSTIVLGSARLVLPNGLSMSGNDQITIAPGGSLKMFVGGSSCTVGGNGILNESGYAQNFVLEATPSVTTFNFNGNGEFIGVLVAPNADMEFNGGGLSNNNFIGSVMMNSIGMNGHFSFHYDEALSRLPADGRILITSWDEIP